MKLSTHSSQRIPIDNHRLSRQRHQFNHTGNHQLSLISKRSTFKQDRQKGRDPFGRPASKDSRLSSRMSSRSSVRSQLTSRTQRGKLVIEGLEEADIYTICSFVDGLLEQRLKWLVDVNKVKGSQIKEVNQSLEKVRDHLFERRASDDTDEMSKEELDSKLLLIDKILAETAVEGEILREKYFNLVNSRTTANKFFSFNKSCDNLRSLMPNRVSRIQQTQSPKISIVKHTSYNNGFTAPKKQLISLWKQPKKKYSYNLFPVPSSNYKINYPSKENASPYPPATKEETFNAFKQYYRTDMSASLYSSDFSPKRQSQYINYKEQDCYKDKIKTLKIKYEPVKKLAIPMNKLAKLEREYSNLLTKTSSFHRNPSFQSHFMTTSLRDFNGIFKAKAVGKHQQIQKLKINYRNLVNLSKSKH